MLKNEYFLQFPLEIYTNVVYTITEYKKDEIEQ